MVPCSGTATNNSHWTALCSVQDACVCVCVCVCLCVCWVAFRVQLFVILLTVALYPWDFPGKNPGGRLPLPPPGTEQLWQVWPLCCNIVVVKALLTIFTWSILVKFYGKGDKISMTSFFIVLLSKLYSKRVLCLGFSRSKTKRNGTLLISLQALAVWLN